MTFDSELGNRRTQTRTALGGKAGLVYAIEPFKDLGLMFRRNPLPVVTDSDHRFAACLLRLENVEINPKPTIQFLRQPLRASLPE